MADLEARFDDPNGESRLLWRQPLPEDREVSIGRNPLHLSNVPPENRAEWNTDPADTFVSGLHAFVRWDGAHLQVRIRTVPKKPQNAIFYQGAPNDKFVMAPGEQFVIGNTHFALHAGDTVETGADDANSNPQVTQFRMDTTELRHVVFDNPAHALKALEQFPDLVRYSRDEVAREERLLKLAIESLRQADVAAIVQADERNPNAKATVRRIIDRRPHRKDPEFRPSNTLTRQALWEMDYRIHLRGQDGDSRAADITMEAGLDWMFCVPLITQDGPSRLGLYVTGRLPGPFADPKQTPAELTDYFKVLWLAAQIYVSAHELRRAEQEVNRYKGFLSKNLVKVLNTADADELLRPKETEVTVLFCDLRGSCRLAECGAQNLIDNWTRISGALDIMTRNIVDEGGVIGDLQGDAAMGFWGWPFQQADQVARAARAALKIQRDFARRPDDRLADARCGIGLAHGRAVAGRLGTYDQIKLDVFGPVVNLASRLEGLTKQFGVSILVDKSVAAAVREADPSSTWAQTRPLGKVCPVGMETPCEVAELAEAGTFSEQQRRVWEAAVSAFNSGRFDGARDKLEQFAMMCGSCREDKAAAFLKQQMDRHRGRAPSGWDGVIKAESK